MFMCRYRDSKIVYDWKYARVCPCTQMLTSTASNFLLSTLTCFRVSFARFVKSKDASRSCKQLSYVLLKIVDDQVLYSNDRGCRVGQGYCHLIIVSKYIR